MPCVINSSPRLISIATDSLPRRIGRPTPPRIQKTTHPVVSYATCAVARLGARDQARPRSAIVRQTILRTSIQRITPNLTTRPSAALRASVRSPWLWLAVRIWVGWYWLDAGRDTVGGAHQLAATLTVGQTLIGIAILLGLLTGLSALAGLGLAATSGLASADPIVALLAIGLVLAWRYAGGIGLDRWILPLVADQRSVALSRRQQGHPGRHILNLDTPGLGNAPRRESK